MEFGYNIDQGTSEFESVGNIDICGNFLAALQRGLIANKRQVQLEEAFLHQLDKQWDDEFLALIAGKHRNSAEAPSERVGLTAAKKI